LTSPSVSLSWKERERKERRISGNLSPLLIGEGLGVRLNKINTKAQRKA